MSDIENAMPDATPAGAAQAAQADAMDRAGEMPGAAPAGTVTAEVPADNPGADAAQAVAAARTPRKPRKPKEAVDVKARAALREIGGFLDTLVLDSRATKQRARVKQALDDCGET